jgi:hypothetical protein
MSPHFAGLNYEYPLKTNLFPILGDESMNFIVALVDYSCLFHSKSMRIIVFSHLWREIPIDFTRWCPPSDVCWSINHSNYFDISTSSTQT